MRQFLKQLEARAVAPVSHAIAQSALLVWYVLQYAYCSAVNALTGRCPHGRGWSNTLLFLRWDDRETAKRTKKCRVCSGLHTRAL